LTLLLSVVALLLAPTLPSTASAMAMSAQMPCPRCPNKIPAKSDLGKMACGALVCAEFATLSPARQGPFSRVATPLSYARDIAADISGASPLPEPYPPRPAALG
jgi:hypothetical protein